MQLPNRRQQLFIGFFLAYLPRTLLGIRIRLILASLPVMKIFFTAIVAQAQLPAPPIDVVRLTATGGACASGIKLSSSVYLTTLHFVDTMCNGDNCQSLSTHSDVHQEENALKVLPVLRLPLYDLAFLSTSGSQDSDSIIKLMKPLVGAAQPRQKITLVSYPSCKEKKESSGVIEMVSLPTMITSTRGGKGSSGGALISEDGKLVGIATESVSIVSSLFHLFFGTSFSVKASSLHNLFSTIPEQVTHDFFFDHQIVTLIDNYINDTLLSQGFGRFIKGTRFIESAQRLFAENFGQSDSTDLLSLTNFVKSNWNIPLIEISPQQSHSSSFLLCLLANLERLGPQGLESMGSYHPWLLRSLNASHLKQFNQALSIAKRANYVGTVTMTSSLFVSALLLSIIFSSVWAYTLGLTWGWLGPSSLFIYKLWMTTIVAFGLWPLSFFIFLFKYKPKSKK